MALMTIQTKNTNDPLSASEFNQILDAIKDGLRDIKSLSVITDTINEKTTDAGVTIDSVLVKNTEIDLPAGAIYKIDGTQIDGSDVQLGSVTDDAQLKRSSNDFSTFTDKASPVSADILLIEDSADSGSKKKVSISNLPTGAIVWG